MVVEKEKEVDEIEQEKEKEKEKEEFLSRSVKKRHEYGGVEFYTRVLKSPRHAIAPMVEYGLLAFRVLCRRHGADLSYTPMLHSKVFCKNKHYRETNFTTCTEDRPLVAQVCGDDPYFMLKAGRILESKCDAIDINFGCPQKIARRGHYGAYLLEEWDVIKKLVTTLSQGLKIPLFCKIRLLLKQPFTASSTKLNDDGDRKTKRRKLSNGEHGENKIDVERTIMLAKKLEKWGCQLLTIHGRTILDIGELKGDDADWKAIDLIRKEISIPVIANGGINCHEDVDKCLSATNTTCCMVGNSLLRNPAIFEKNIVDKMEKIKLAFEFLDIVEEYSSKVKAIRGNLIKMLLDCTWKYSDIRFKLSRIKTVDEGRLVLKELQQRLDTNAPAYVPDRKKKKKEKKKEKKDNIEKKRNEKKTENSMNSTKKFIQGHHH